jgi:hypothetical protein
MFSGRETNLKLICNAGEERDHPGNDADSENIALPAALDIAKGITDKQ